MSPNIGIPNRQQPPPPDTKCHKNLYFYSVMNLTKMDSEIFEAFQMLGFDEIDQFPTLQEVRKGFFDCARRYHPDKNIDSDENTKEEREEIFKKLLNAYTLVSETIIESYSTENEEGDEDEDDSDYDTEDQGFDEIEFEKEEYKEVNMFSTNTKSVTYKIPTIHADAWKAVLGEQIGIKCDRSKSSNGIQFKTLSGVSITLWKKIKEEESTILIDGKKDYLDFAENEIRKLYFLVKRKLKRKDIDKKRKCIDLPSSNVQCKECPKTATSDKLLRLHIKTCHTEMEKPTLKKTKVIAEASNTSEVVHNKDVTMIDLTEDLPGENKTQEEQTGKDKKQEHAKEVKEQTRDGNDEELAEAHEEVKCESSVKKGENKHEKAEVHSEGKQSGHPTSLETQEQLKIILYKCKNCRDTFNTVQKMGEHNSIVHGNEQTRCRFCKKTFTTLEDLQYHIYEGHSPNLFECSSCGKGFETSNEMQDHIKLSHSHQCVHESKHEKESADGNEANGYFTCSVCCKKFTMITDVWLHVAKEHEKKEVNHDKLIINILAEQNIRLQDELVSFKNDMKEAMQFVGEKMIEFTKEVKTDLEKSLSLVEETISNEAGKEEVIVNVILSQLSVIRNDLSQVRNEQERKKESSRKKEETERNKYDKKKEHKRKEEENTKKVESKREDHGDKKKRKEDKKGEELERNKKTKEDKETKEAPEKGERDERETSKNTKNTKVEKSSSNENNKKIDLNCYRCGLKFKNEKEVNNHMKSYHGRSRNSSSFDLNCYKCGIQFWSERETGIIMLIVDM